MPTLLWLQPLDCQLIGARLLLRQMSSFTRLPTLWDPVEPLVEHLWMAEQHTAAPAFYDPSVVHPSPATMMHSHPSETAPLHAAPTHGLASIYFTSGTAPVPEPLTANHLPFKLQRSAYYKCKYCARIKRTTSGCSKGSTTRIRCECGGHSQDGQIRMHSK